MIRAATVLFATTALAASTIGAQLPADPSPTLASARAWLSDSVLGVGPGGSWLRTERGFSIGSLSSSRDPIEDAPSLPRVLQGRLPGVSVSQGEGLVGSSTRVWLRGPNSLFVNEPLLIIDGARTHAVTVTRPFDLGPLPSRLEDIDPESIERIDVLRGAAASAIYGPGASKGVILVTTKRGREGPARWSAFAESGPLMETTNFPANFGTTGVSNVTALPVENCPLSAQASGSCEPLVRRSWNPLENASPFRTGWSNAAGLNVSGGQGQVSYRASANHDRTTGVYRRDEGSATSASANVGVALTPSVDMRFIGAYRTEDLRHPTADYIQFGMRGASVDDPATRGYAFDGAEEAGRSDEGGRRITAAVHAAWRPSTWLRASAIIGYDRLRSEHFFRVRQEFLAIPGIPGSGDSVTFIDRARDTPESRTGTAEVEAMYRSFGVSLRSAVGFQYLRDDDRGESFVGQIPDTPGGPAFQDEVFASARRITKGLYARQHFGWGRAFLTGTMRVDKPSVDLFGTMYSPSVDASWMPIRSTDASSPIVSELRFRAAYGRGAGHLIPTLRQSAGPSALEPSRETAERMTELELGADAAFLDGRLLVQVTGYRATNDQGLIGVSAPVSGGFQTYVSNIAEFRTGGLELVMDARLLERGALRWDAGIGFARHRVRTENTGVPTATYGPGNQRLENGDGLVEYHPGTYTWFDQNGDQLIAPSEVELSTTDFPSVGSPIPEYEASLHTDVAIGRTVRISALLDRRAGHKLYNAEERARCSFAPNCADQHDPETPLADQAAAVAAQEGNIAGYIEDASFTRLREVKVSFALPARWTGSASSARLSLTGRNLYTWTGYRGLDPEVISRDRDSVVGAESFFQPTLRSFTVRVEVTW